MGFVARRADHAMDLGRVGQRGTVPVSSRATRVATQFKFERLPGRWAACDVLVPPLALGDQDVAISRFRPRAP
eukprot:5425231-Prymnesium_polylepis.1